MKVLVTGARGLLGYDVCKELERRKIEFRGVNSKDFNLIDSQAIQDYVMDYAPDAVIHCAAYTAVDRAEDEPELCRQINVFGTQVLAMCCQRLGGKLVYPSTDYVFPGEGDQPYETDSATGPLNVYGQTKLAGEEAVRTSVDRHFIVRISWIFGVNGKNFVRTMLNLGKAETMLRVVGDQIGSPTYAHDLAPLLCDMLETNRYGTYHATNEGFCSWAEYAQEIFGQAGLDTVVLPQTSSEFSAKAIRPSNSRLSKRSLDAAGFSRLPHWKDALTRYLTELEGKL